MGAVSTLVTAEQLLEMTDRRCELVRGEIIDMCPPGFEHGYLALQLGLLLAPYVKKYKLGWVTSEIGVVLARDPDTVRAPDLAFIAKTSGRRTRAYNEGPPDLAVEVLSPTDRPGATLKKISEYLEAGCRLVWVIDPDKERVTAYRLDGELNVYTADQDVPGEDVIPGFSFRLRELLED